MSQSSSGAQLPHRPAVFRQDRRRPVEDVADDRVRVDTEVVVYRGDFLFREWNDKAAGFVGYGSVGGVRAVENLRLVMGELKVADVRAQVALSLRTDFENYTTLKPGAHQEAAVNAMLDDLIPWGQALR